MCRVRFLRAKHPRTLVRSAKCTSKISEKTISKSAGVFSSRSICGHNAARLARIDIPFLLATGCDAIFLHDALDPVLPRLEQSRQFAVAHRIILFMPLFNRDGHCFIFARLFSFEIEGSSSDLQCSGYLAFGVGTVRPTQSVRQFDLLCRFYFLNSPEAFFRISFCTVNSPMIFFKSSGDCPGSYP